MSGESAYEIYVAKMAELGVNVDNWNSLTDIDQEAWNFMATEVWEHGYNARVLVAR